MWFLKKTSFAGFGAVIALILFFLACNKDSGGNVYMNVKGDPNWLQYDTLVVVLQSPGKADDTLFNAKLNSLADLEHLQARDYNGEAVKIVVTGKKNRQIVFRENRNFDGTNSVKDTTINLPINGGQITLDIRPDNLLLFLGGPKDTLTANPTATWAGKTLTWTSSDSTVVTVTSKGIVTPVGVGAAYIRASAGDTLNDQSKVTVVRDAPVLDVGAADTAILLGSSVSFQVKATQAYGTLTRFAWDLDGDGQFDDSTVSIPDGTTWLTTKAHAYSTAGDFTINFHVLDGEGNLSSASKKVKVTDKVPLINALTAKPTLINIQDAVDFTADVGVTAGSLASYRWDYNDDGTPDDSGSLSGSKATVTGNFRYPKAGLFKAKLTVIDSNGTAITGQAVIDVREDIPVASAGNDTAVEPGAKVYLHGNAKDTLGRIVRMEWKIGTADFFAVSTGDTSFIAPAEGGDVVCVFRVLDDDGLSAQDTVKISVASSGAPVLSALNRDTIITIKDSVYFTAKVDAKTGTLKSYTFDYDGDGKVDASGDLSGISATLSGKFQFVAPGNYTATLKVTDAAGKTGVGQVHVQVKLDPPYASAGNDTAVKAGAKVNLHGVAVDTMGKIVKMEWKVGDANYATVTSSDYSFIAPATAGDVLCEFRATDDDGQTAEDTVKVTVSDAAAPSLSAISHDTTITIKDSVSFSAQADAASEPQLKTYAWDYNGDGTVDDSGNLTGHSAVVLGGYRFPTAGTYTVTLKVTDANAMVGTAQIRVVVKQDLPIAGAGKDTTVAAGTLVNLHGTAVDSMGQIVKREWKINGGAFAASRNDTSFTAPSIGGALQCIFRVTDDDGQTAQDTVQVVVSASTNADLSGIALSAGTLSPAFLSGTVSYSAGVGNGFGSITVTPTAANSGSTLTVNGNAVNSGSASTAIPLAVGPNTVTIVVTAQDGTTKKTYTVSVTRSGNSDATLSGLSLSAGSLSPVFASATTNYTASVANTTTSLTVTPTVSGSGASVKVNNVAVTSGTASGAISLNVGANTVTILVTAQDGSTATYTVAVTRGGSSDASLSALSLSSGTLSPTFASGTLNYSASISNATSSITITPTATSSAATIKVNGATVASGSASGTISHAVGAYTDTVKVTAQDGSTTTTYLITVTRAASSNADLSNLIMASTTLSPSTFSSSTTSYTAAVPFSRTSETFTPTSADPTATIKVNGTAVTSGQASGALSFNVGPNSDSVVVTAGDGVTTKTYRITVFRDGDSQLKFGYAWNDNPTSASHTLTSYAYNSAGGAITVTRITTGRYTVSFAGLGGNGTSNSGGHAEASAYGSDSGATCKVKTTNSLGTSFDVDVYCFTKDGTGVDHYFTVYAGWPHSASTGYNAYLLADQPTSASAYAPSNLYSYNSSNAPITVTRTATGSYNAIFTGLNDISNAVNVKATAYGQGSERCIIDSWGTAVNTSVNLHCVNTAAGTAVDTKFNLEVLMPSSSGSTMAQGFAWSNYLDTNTTTLGAPYSYNSTGGTVTGKKTGTGSYTVTFTGLGAANSRDGNVQVTAYGGNGSCQVGGWGTESVTVYCYNAAGALSDNNFSVWMIK